MKNIIYSNRKKLILAILLLAFVLRFYKLGQIPLSLDWDENSNAYNAYSILKTGRDEYGTFLPITNRSFDDYKPPLYMYLNIPTVAIFGLTPIAARLPSALFGFLTVPFIYFLAKWLFKTYDKRDNETIALIATLFVAISPWHIQFNRVGFESSVGLFTAVVAITTFLYGLDNKKLLIVSALFTALSAYSYHSERIFVPLLFIATGIIYRKEILKIPKKLLITFVALTIILSLPLAILIPPKVILQRFEATTGRPSLEDIEKSIKFIRQDQAADIPFAGIIHNRRFVIGQTYFANYLLNFDFNFLFTKGDDNLRHHIKDIGMLYLPQLPLLLIGVFYLIKQKSKESAFLLSWLLISPIAAVPATPNPHANRAFPEVIALEIICAFGLYWVLIRQKFFAKSILVCILALWSIYSTLLYIHNYFVHYPIEDASFWQYGYNQAALESQKLENQYQKINVDHSIEQAYVFWLFNLKYDPTTYQKSGSRYQFDKYYFDAKEPTDPNELFIADNQKFPQGFEVIKTIYYPDGSPAVKMGHPK